MCLGFKRALFVLGALVAIFAVTTPSSCVPFGAGDDPISEGGAPNARDADVDAVTAADAGSSAYAKAVLADLPLAYWRLDETGGTVAHALSSPPIDATIFGNPPTFGVKGAVPDGTAIMLTEQAVQGFEVQRQFEFPDNTAYSLEAWIKLDDADGKYRHVFTNDHEKGSNTLREEYGVYVVNNNGSNEHALVFERFVAGMKRTVPHDLPSFGAWHHIVATYDGKTMELFFDGKSAGTTPDDRPQGPKDGFFFFGTKSQTEGPLLGSIDEVAVYGSALPGARVEAHFMIGSQGR